MGTGTFTSPQLYDSDPTLPGFHAAINYVPGVGNVHTLLSIDLTRDADSPYDKLRVTRASDNTDWVSPVVPIGSMTITQAQINSQGFFVVEDINGITSIRIGQTT